jgi:hypothetical protein
MWDRIQVRSDPLTPVIPSMCRKNYRWNLACSHQGQQSILQSILQQGCDRMQYTLTHSQDYSTIWGMEYWWDLAHSHQEYSMCRIDYRCDKTFSLQGYFGRCKVRIQVRSDPLTSGIQQHVWDRIQVCSGLHIPEILWIWLLCLLS